MKNLRNKLFILFLILQQAVFSQAYKGLYVDGFDKIIGNRNLEDELLKYCKTNGFNALCTYKTKNIEMRIHI